MIASPGPSIIASCCALLAVACGAEAEPRVGDATLAFAEEGLTEPATIPPFSGEALVLHARTDPDTCFAIASMTDGTGRSWATGREPGPYCTDCSVRTSVARREALFVLTKDGAFDPSAGLTLRFGLVRCDTLTPLRSATGQRLELSWLPRAAVPERGSVSLRFVVSEHSMLRGRPELTQELLSHLNGELAETGLEVSLDDVVEANGVARESRFSATELGELEAMLETVSPAPPATVDIVFAGCLRFDDLLGPPKAVDGFTPRVLGGVGPAPAIFMPGRRCDGFADAPATFPPKAYAHTLAHELGHFLGLYHSVEGDGSTDLLSDTSEANIMNHNPSLAMARGFSPRQGREMRAHPWVVPR